MLEPLPAWEETAWPPREVGGDIRPPIKISDPPPNYTVMARKARLQGVVIVQVIIDPEGRVHPQKVLKGLRMGLSEAVVDAMRRWRFEPATLNGEPVAVYYNLTSRFTLQ